jgi:hypothetical protein
VKKSPSIGRTKSHEYAPAKKLRALKKCLNELHALYTEAATILHDLLSGPSNEIIRDLCARFLVLQEYFAMRYHQARALAISALGTAEAGLSFP